MAIVAVLGLVLHRGLRRMWFPQGDAFDLGSETEVACGAVAGRLWDHVAVGRVRDEGSHRFVVVRVGRITRPGAVTELVVDEVVGLGGSLLDPRAVLGPYRDLGEARTALATADGARKLTRVLGTAPRLCYLPALGVHPTGDAPPGAGDPRLYCERLADLGPRPPLPAHLPTPGLAGTPGGPGIRSATIPAPGPRSGERWFGDGPRTLRDFSGSRTGP